MIKGCEEFSAPEPIISWSKFKNNMKNMRIKHESMWSLKLGNTCG